MIGSWAGELGQTQMMPSEYMAHAVDYDGDGRRNLIKSVPDVIGSTGNYLVHLGWKRGEPWLQEVRVPAKPAVERGRPFDPASALAMGGLGRDACRRQGRCRPTICRPPWCFRWADLGRLSSPTTISRPI